MGNATAEADAALERGLNRRHPTDLAGRVVPAGSAPGIPPPSLVDLAVAFPFTFPAWRRQRRGPGEPPAVLPTTPSFLLPPDGAIPGLFGGGDKKGRAAKEPKVATAEGGQRPPPLLDPPKGHRGRSSDHRGPRRGPSRPQEEIFLPSYGNERRSKRGRGTGDGGEVQK